MKHTAFPYAVAFMPEARRRLLQDKALDAPQSKGTSSLIKNISHGVAYRRLCPLCVEEDLARYGETFWRRSHLLPGVLVCLHHHVELNTCELPVRGNAQSRSVLLPHMVCALPIFSNTAQATLNEVAAMSTKALAWETDAPEDFRQAYRVQAAALGYTVPSGDVAGQPLALAFRDFFTASYLEEAGCPVNAAAENPWPALMVRLASGFPFASPKHVFMNVFLNRHHSVLDDLTTNYGRPGPKPRDFSALDELTLVRLRQAAKELAANRKRATVEHLLREAGVWATYRHRRNMFPLTRTFIQAFRMSDQSERQIGRRMCWRRHELGGK